MVGQSKYNSLVLAVGFIALISILLVGVSLFVPDDTVVLPTPMVLPGPYVATPSGLSSVFTASPSPAAVSLSVLAVPTDVPARPTTEPVMVILPQSPVPDRVIVRFTPGASVQEQQAYIHQIQALGGKVSKIDGLNSLVIDVPSHVELPASPALEKYEPDYYAVAQSEESSSSSDPLLDNQWALSVTGARSAWQRLTVESPVITVAVIDSGVCLDHVDLSGRISAGWDYVENDSVPQDEFGHGCGVSGIIAAGLNNGVGIAGAAPNARILPVRVLNAQGIGRYSDVAAAIVYAVDHGAQIINLSLGGTNPSDTLQLAVSYAVSRGALVVAAAGNAGSPGVLYPAAYEQVIAVGSIDPNLQTSSFSNYGPKIGLWAPGRDILTTERGGGYALMSGTSFAAPYVSAIAALEIGLGSTLAVNGGIVTVGGGPAATPTPVSMTADIAPTLAAPAANVLLFNTEAQGALNMNNNTGVIRSRYVEINFNAVSETGASTIGAQSARDDAVILNLFDDVTYTAAFERVDGHDLTSNGFVWIGRLDGIEGGEVIMVTGDGQMEGYVIAPGELYQITYAGNGLHAVNEIDPAAFASLHTNPLPMPVPDGAVISAASVPSQVEASGLTMIDLMVVYTTEVRTNQGGTSAMNNAIMAAVAATNQAYINSRINLRVRLVYAAEVSYTDNGSTDLERITNSADGYMDVVHAWRNSVNADLVTLITERGGYCGIAWLLGSTQIPYGPSATAPYGFSVVRRVCLPGGLTLAHELGHNMGADHDYANRTSPGFPPAYSYAYGYVDPQSTFRDIMSYASTCSANSPCVLLNYFANPDISFAERPLGSASANVARALNNTAGFVAAYRGAAETNVSPTSTPLAPTLTPTSASPTPVPTSTMACNFNVAAGDVNGLINAINTANGNGAGADTICLASGATYTVTSGPYTYFDDYEYNAFPAIDSNVRIVGNGATITRGGAGQFRFFYIQSGASLDLNGLTLDNGFATGSYTQDGGAILNSGTLVAARTIFRNNQADDYGGAIFSFGSVTIRNSLFTGNAAYGGGVIAGTGTMTVTGTNFVGNMGTAGSVLYYYGDNTVYINDSCLTGNPNSTIFNDSSSSVVNAKNNWWGSSQGPSPETALIPGAGDIVGAGVDFVPFQLSIISSCPPPPSPPWLLSPAIDGLTNNNKPQMVWAAVQNATKYQLQIAASASFTSGLQSIDVLTGTSYTFTTALSDAVYYWRVRGHTDLLPGEWSEVRTLTIDTTPPPVPSLIAPTNSSSTTSPRPTFQWTTAPTAMLYEFRYGTANPPATTYSLSGTSYTPALPLLIGTYYWQVRARDAIGNWSGWSSVHSVGIVSASGAAPPRNYYRVNQPLLTWDRLSWAVGYEIQVDTVTTFNSTNLWYPAAFSATTFKTTTPPLQDGVWYWRVRAKKSDGTWGTWSKVESFIVDVP